METKKVHTRSPNYPSLPLEEAIQKARVIWEHAKRNPVQTEVVAKYWKYGPKSSGWRLALAALKRFGLVEYVGSKKSGEVKLTDLALRILLDVQGSSPERERAIKDAALTPGIYRELWSHWGGNLPSDDTAQTYLTLNKGFNEASVPGFLADFKKTISFAKLGATDIILDIIQEAGKFKDGEADADGEENGVENEAQRRPLRRRPMQSGMKEDVFNLDEGPVVVQYPDRMSEASYQDLEDYLQLVIRKAKRSIVSDDGKTEGDVP
jgi:hypothetical protein